MKKRITALLLCALLILPAMPAADAAFTDISDPETAVAAAALQGLGIVAGTSANSFTPNNSLSRAEACALLINTKGLSGQVNTYKQRTVFSDVLPSAWYTGIVNLAHAQSIISGYGNGTFGPEDKVTYGQFATMLLRLLGYSSEEIGSVWPYDYTAFCDNLGLSEGLDVQPERELTRGQAAVLLYRTLKTNQKGGSKPYYNTLSGVASSAEGILLDTNASYGGTDGLLKLCSTTGSGSVAYYEQAKPQNDVLVGARVAVLLDNTGETVGVIPLEDDIQKHKVVSSREVVLLDTDATYEGTSGLLKASPLDGSAGAAYYTQVTRQNDALVDNVVTLLLDGSNQVVGMYAGSETYPGVQIASRKQALLLDVNTELGGETGLLMAYGMDGTPGVAYYNQVVPQQGALTGTVVMLQLDKRGDVVAVVPHSTGYRDVTVASAKGSGIVGEDGMTYRVSASAVTIVGDTGYTWGSNGYIQVNNRVGQTARLFYDDGVVTYVCLTAGTVGTNAQVAVAQSDTAASELARKLGISGSYTITKNGAPAKEGDLTRYDTAYFDEVSKTLCASDYRLTGYIQSAQPSLDAAQTITVSGCSVPVLEAAWETLENYKLGDRVTLLLTDDCKVAAAVSDTLAGREMVGVLSTDGRSVTLCGSGLEISAQDMKAEEKLCGTLVRVYVDAGQITCYDYTGDRVGGSLNLETRMLGTYKLAPGCAIYEQSGNDGYLHSLSGELGVASTDFEEIFWTDTITSSAIGTVRLNSAGQVELLVLKDVTGNCYEYGRLTRYSDEEGILTQSSPKRIYADAVTITNGSGQSKKYLCGEYLSVNGAYFGIALKSSDSSNQQVAAATKLIEVKNVASSAFFLDGDAWYVLAGGSEMPVSESVQIHFESTNQWSDGIEAIHTALANGTALNVYYDRAPLSGAQVRVIVVKEA